MDEVQGDLFQQVETALDLLQQSQDFGLIAAVPREAIPGSGLGHTFQPFFRDIRIREQLSIQTRLCKIFRKSFNVHLPN